MTDKEWDAIVLLLDGGFVWREPFDAGRAKAYRVLLDGYTAEQIVSAVRLLIAKGQKFGPVPGELVAAMNDDPSRPTFTEMMQLVYGRGGVLRARPEQRWFDDEIERDRAYQEAARTRAAQLHPLVASFVERYGIDRLRGLEIEHEDYGELRRRDLEQAWTAHVAAMQDRDQATLVSRGDGRLNRFDPLAALGYDRKELRPGEGEAPVA